MIKIGINSIITSYQSYSMKHNTNNRSNTEKVGPNSDYFEISSEGKEMFKMSEIMKIHEKGFNKVPTKEESDYYWAVRKSNPELDSYLYEKDKAEALKFVGQVQRILMKVGSGQPLTPEEEEIVKNDPALKQEIEIRSSAAKLFK